MGVAELTPHGEEVLIPLGLSKVRHEAQAEHLPQHVCVTPIERRAHFLPIVRALAHDMVIDVVADKHDAMEFVLVAAHLTLDLPARIHQATQDDGVDDLNTLSAPSLVEIIEEHPNGLLLFEVGRYLPLQSR